MDQAFLAAAHDYRGRLAATADGNAFRELWRTTNLAYAMEAHDPYSPEYRNEVLAMFQALTAQAYDTGLEMTSTKQGGADFQLGYPWVSRNPAVIATELAKTVQAFQALQAAPPPAPVVEFGAGWGNLSVPLAQAGYDVTTVDLDSGFNTRLRRLASERGVALQVFEGTFMQAVEQLPGPYAAVVFQSSFHHCLDFDAMLGAIAGGMLAPDGSIFFLSEPVYDSLGFPWGLRYDGEALWAIMCNGWLELGFSEDFFTSLLLRHGLLPTRVAGVPGHVGPGWRAQRAQVGARLAELVLPARYDAGFHAAADVGWGRFCRASAVLPGMGRPSCTLALRNFGPIPLCLTLRSGTSIELLTVQPHEARQVAAPLHADDLHITSEIWVPNAVIGNGDERELGVAVIDIRWD